MTAAHLKITFKEELSGLYPPAEINALFALIAPCIFHTDNITLLLHPEKQTNKETIQKFRIVVRKLKKHVPVQYILGHCDFYGLPLQVNADVLIPRPETEELVQWIIDDLRNQYSELSLRKLSILDIGTGSGCIALALKKNLSSIKMSAADISIKALRLARRNAKANKLNVKFIKADILKSSKNGITGAFDIIVSNPPYIPESEKKILAPNVLKEPGRALFVPNNNPLLYYHAIAHFAKKALKKQTLYFEINEEMAEELYRFLSNSGFEDIIIRKDINGKDRMVKCTFSPQLKQT